MLITGSERNFILFHNAVKLQVHGIQGYTKN